MIVVVLFSPVFAEARILNLRGSLTLDYRLSQSDSSVGGSKVETFGQRYNLGMGGRIFRFGQYSLSGAWINDRIKTENQFQGTPAFKQEHQLTIQEFRIFTSLFAKASPLSLSAQRIIRENEFEGSSSKNIIDVVSATWTLNMRRVPRTVFSYTQSRLQSSGSSGGSEDFENQSLSVQTEGEIEKTHLSLGYQWAESKSGQRAEARSQAVNFNLRSFLTSALIFTANGRYSSSEIPPSVVVPGTTIFQSRGAGLSLIYRPPLHWWNGRVSYTYSENPFVKNLKSHGLAGSLSLRPHSKLSASLSARIGRIERGKTSLTSESVSSSASYRPTFGISTSLGAGFSHTLSSNSTDTNTYTQNYNYNLSYFKTLRRARVNSNYSLGYGQSNTEPGGTKSQSLTNSGTLGASNTNTRYVQMTGRLSLINQRSETNDGKSGSTTYRADVNASSQYFKNVIRRGDRIDLRAAASHSNTEGLGLEGGKQNFNSSASYAWHRLSATLVYFIQNLPNEAQLDRQGVTGRMNWSFVPLRSMNVRLRVEDSFVDNRFQNDTNRFEAGVDISYRIGLVGLNLDYFRTTSTIFADSGNTHSTVDSVGAKLTRAF